MRTWSRRTCQHDQLWKVPECSVPERIREVQRLHGVACKVRTSQTCVTSSSNTSFSLTFTVAFDRCPVYMGMATKKTMGAIRWVVHHMPPFVDPAGTLASSEYEVLHLSTLQVKITNEVWQSIQVTAGCLTQTKHDKPLMQHT